MRMAWLISSVRDLRIWANNSLVVGDEEADRVANAIWERADFPHPVDNTDLAEWLAHLDTVWLYEVASPDD